jgi:Prokaryotic homologs of the JAB domain
MDWFPPAVVVLRPALEAMVRGAAASADGSETGGFLFGVEESTNGPQRAVVVRHAGDPGPTADRRPRFFRPDVAHAQQLALDAFAADGSQWVGTWHTHLRWRAGRPSAADLSTYRAHLHDPALGFAHFLSIVLTPTMRVSPPGLCWQHLHCRPWLVTRRGLTAADLVVNDKEPTT